MPRSLTDQFIQQLHNVTPNEEVTESLLDEEIGKEELEARQMQDKHQQQSMLLRQLNDWIRDLLMVSCNVDEPLLTYPMHRSVLVQKRKRRVRFSGLPCFHRSGSYA